MKNNIGFTLIELIIVIAIIGILAAIAYPQYNKYTSHSRQTEVKIALTAIYATEKAFFTDKSSYTACLNAIGFNPEGAVSYYTVGVGNAGGSANCGRTGVNSCLNYDWISIKTCTDGNNATYFLANKAEGTLPGLADLPPGTDVSKNAFIMGGAGSVSTTGANALDKWTINQDKNLINTTNGL